MRVLRHANAESFLDCAGSWLLEAEVENNLILWLARSLQEEALPAASDRLLLTIHEGESVVGCALRSPPRHLDLTRMERAAVDALVHSLRAELPSLPGVVGPEPSSGEFAAQWSKLQQQPSQTRNRGRFYVLRAVRTGLPETPGRLRPATSSDLELVSRWVAQFTEEGATGESQDPREVALRAINRGQLYLWHAPGPVSMAGWAGATPSGRRVNLVFTPPAERRRGYASACVAALSRTILSMGNNYCCLYADLANPTSNSIYARIGYEPVYDVTDYSFER